MSELKYLINSSLIMYARELLNDSDEIFKGYKQGDSISDILEENETLATLTGDLEETVEAMENLDNYELYAELVDDLYHTSQDLNFDRIEGKEDFENTLNELIDIVRKIKI